MAAPDNPAAYRAIWEAKPVLRAVYSAWYARMAALCRPGRTLEIGGGSGNLKAFAPDVISTDILFANWLDVLCDAQRLPFADASFDNIVMMDVLHHLERPVRFFEEAGRVLRSGGRVVMLEPGITPVSTLFYRFFHPEPVDMSADALADGPLDPSRDPYDANQAVPTLLFGGRDRREAFERRVPGLAVATADWLALAVYPLSGGFRPWSLVPAAAVGPLLALEDGLAPLLGRLFGFRLLVVLQRRR
jgi:SAM-dependent methyltransferase